MTHFHAAIHEVKAVLYLSADLAAALASILASLSPDQQAAIGHAKIDRARHLLAVHEGSPARRHLHERVSAATSRNKRKVAS